MRFHVPSLPHTRTSPFHNSCAFTTKVLRFCQMMRSLGHEVVHYGNEGSDLGCDAEHVTIFTTAEQEAYFGKMDPPNRIPTLEWAMRAPYWPVFNERVAYEVAQRVRDREDFLCVIYGGALGTDLQARVDKSVGMKHRTKLTTVEFGIGYTGTFAKYRVFESYCLMHKIWGAQTGFDADGRFYDVVIPNYFDPEDFPFNDSPSDYYLFMGRMIRRKGIRIAVDTTRHIGAKLLLAGQGVKSVEGNKIITEDNQVYEGGHLQYVGIADKAQRAELLRNAKAVFVPTLYVEPFGGVAVEAQMCGTPVITTDFGAMTETVEDGKTGFRCRNMREFVAAARQVGMLDRGYTHDRAVERYSMDVVRYQYQRYFHSLLDLWARGWYETADRPQPEWEEAQRWESNWWGDCRNERVVEEQVKQEGYLKYMGLGDFDMGGKSVLDVGGGPTSVLLRAKNVGRRKVIDPLNVPSWVPERYRNAGIEVEAIPAEDMDESGWDMVLIYNVLQHTRNPEQIVRRACMAGKELRMFEWIDTLPSPGHPHILTREKLEYWTGRKGSVVSFPKAERGLWGKAWVLPART